MVNKHHISHAASAFYSSFYEENDLFYKNILLFRDSAKSITDQCFCDLSDLFDEEDDMKKEIEL